MSAPNGRAGWISGPDVRRSLEALHDPVLRDRVEARLFALARGDSSTSVYNPYPGVQRNSYRCDVVDGCRILFRPLKPEEAVRYDLTRGIAVAALMTTAELQGKYGLQ